MSTALMPDKDWLKLVKIFQKAGFSCHGFDPYLHLSIDGLCPPFEIPLAAAKVFAEALKVSSVHASTVLRNLDGRRR